MDVPLPLLTLLIFSGEFVARVQSKFSIISFTQCDSNVDYSISCNVTVRTLNGLQHLDGTSKLKIPLDNTLKINVTVETLLGQNRHVYLLDIHEKKACEALHKYLGEFSYEIERNMGLIPKMCPIPQGRYALHNMSLHFEKIATLQAFPFGQTRTKLKLVDVRNKVVSCTISEQENRL